MQINSALNLAKTGLYHHPVPDSSALKTQVTHNSKAMNIGVGGF